MSETIVGSVGVQLVPSAKGFSERAKSLLHGLKVDVDGDTKPLEESIDQARSRQKKRPLPVQVMPKLDDFAARIKSEAAAISKSAQVDIPATIEGEKLRRDIAAQVKSIEALTKVEIPTDLRDAASLRAKMADELETLRAMAEAAHPTVTVDVDTGKARAEMAAFAGTGGGGSSGGHGGLIGALAGGIALLGPALVPVTAGFAGVAGYAGLTAKAVTDVEAKSKKIAQLQKTAATTSSKKTYARTVAELKALDASIDAPQRKLLAAQKTLGASFNKLIAKVGPAMFRPLTAGLNVLAHLMPQLAPLIPPVSRALLGLVNALGKSVKNGGFKDFIGYIVSTIPPVIRLVETFGGALVHLFTSLAPAGMVMVGLLTQVFSLFSSLPSQVIAPLAAGLVGLIGGPQLAALAATITLFEGLYASSESFRTSLAALGNVVQTNLMPVWTQLVATWQTQLLPTLRQIGPQVGTLIGQWIIMGTAVAGAVLPPLIKLGGIIFSYVLPAMAKLEQMHFGGLLIAFNALGRAAITLAQIVGKAIGFLLSAFASATSGFASVLSALGHVPGFGWAKDAAGAMREAASTASALANSVNNIPSWHDITIAIHTVRTTTDIDGDVYRGPKSGGTAPKAPAPKKPPKSSSSSSGSVPSVNIPSFSGGGGGSKHHGVSAAARAKKEARKLLTELNSALKVGGTQLQSVLSKMITNITDFPKKFRTPLRQVENQFKTLTANLTNLKSKMKDLATTISQAFMPSNLFGGTLSDLASGLSSGLSNVMNGLNAQKLLVAAGVPAAFVAALLSSGNGNLAAQLAANPTLALGFADQYSQITSLSNQLGASAAGAQYNPQIDATNQQLKDLNTKITHLADQIGKSVGHAINGSASKAKRRSRGNG